MEKSEDLHSPAGHDPRRQSISSSANHTSDEESSISSQSHRPATGNNRANSDTYSLGDNGWESIRAPTNNMSMTRTVSRRESALSRIRSRPIPQFTHPLAHVKTTEDQLVDFDGPDDPYRPMNWPTKKKVITTMLYGLVTMSATWASSSYSSGTRQVAEHFHVGTQVATLGTTLFLVGFGIGPLLWAPLSEVYGRRQAVLIPMFIALCFSFGSAVAKDLQTLMITRFFCAFFASAPVTNTGGVLGDLYPPTERGIAMAGYAMAVVGGPVLGMSCFRYSIASQKAVKLTFPSFRPYCISCCCARTKFRLEMDRVPYWYCTDYILDTSNHLC